MSNISKHQATIEFTAACFDLTEHLIEELLLDKYVGMMKRFDAISSEDWWEGGWRSRTKNACNAIADEEMKAKAVRILQGFDRRFPKKTALSTRISVDHTKTSLLDHIFKKVVIHNSSENSQAY